MTFSFSSEQDELRASVRKFLAQRSSSEAVRAQIDGTAGYDEDVWRQMADQMGLAGLAIPEEYDGSGFGPVELGIVLEETGRTLLCSPYFATVALAGQVLTAAGDQAAKRRWLPAIAAGELTATLAVAEASGSWELASTTTRATPEGDGWLLDGTKMFVVDGHSADLVLVIARTPQGLGLFAVAADAANLTKSRLDALDLTRRLARLEFAGTPAVLASPPGDATEVLHRVLDLVYVAASVEQVGGAQRCLDMAVEYAKLRVQFGRPIGSFQAIKHKCADMLIEVESARSAAYYAIGVAADGPADELPSAAALAKAYCSEAYTRTAKENIQVHGGIGFTWEHDAHLYLRRAKSSELLFGAPARHRERLAELVGI
jgi:alkylation response protein AidB-like acyl-CoA dehydrogenase